MEEKDYARVKWWKWFLIVELPWLFFILGLVCPIMILAEAAPDGNLTDQIWNGVKPDVISCLACAAIGFIAIFVTIPFKHKVWEARGCYREFRNPYSWFLSKTAKIVLGTLFWIAAFVIIIALLFIARGGDLDKKGRVKYRCQECGRVMSVSSVNSLPSHGCSGTRSGEHIWGLIE